MQAQNLVVMRHAKSEWDAPARTDFERPLAPRGKRDAKIIGKWLLKQSIAPTHIVSSAALRASQTAELVGAELGATPITFDEALYLADLHTLIRCLEHPPAEHWMLVGHNPGIQEFVEFCDPGIRLRTEFSKIMPTAGVYVFAIDAAPTPHESCGRLIAHQRPKLLAR